MNIVLWLGNFAAMAFWKGYSPGLQWALADLDLEELGEEWG